MVEMPVVTRAWVRRWCAERSLSEDSVCVLVVLDYGNKTRVPHSKMSSLASYIANCKYYKLRLGPDISPRAGDRKVGATPATSEGDKENTMCLMRICPHTLLQSELKALSAIHTRRGLPACLYG